MQCPAPTKYSDLYYNTLANCFWLLAPFKLTTREELRIGSQKVTSSKRTDSLVLVCTYDVL
eukprot:scaffold1608_cov140-Skeletonema_dohrnii-CCMP3373.AAC.2